MKWFKRKFSKRYLAEQELLTLKQLLDDTHRDLVAEQATNESLLKANHQYRNRVDELRGKLLTRKAMLEPVPISDKQQLQALSREPEESPLVAVFFRCLEDRLKLARDRSETEDIQNRPGELSFHCGGACYLEDVKYGFLDLWADARTTLAKKPKASKSNSSD